MCMLLKFLELLYFLLLERSIGDGCSGSVIVHICVFYKLYEICNNYTQDIEDDPS